MTSSRSNASGLNPDIFDDVPRNKIRFQKPVRRAQAGRTASKPVVRPSLKKISDTDLKKESPSVSDSEIVVGSTVEHNRFGIGKVRAIEGVGGNKKAAIVFETAGTKKLLLQFAKLKLIH